METNKSTTWSKPNTNFIAGVFNLRHALNFGYNAILIREWNENCAHPIKNKINGKNQKFDINNYHSKSCTYTTYNQLVSEYLNATDNYPLYATLNYIICYGRKEAVENYQKTGVLTKDNNRGMGVAHPVKVKDLYDLYIKEGDSVRADLLYETYYDETKRDVKFFFNVFTLKHYPQLPAKKFKHKLWVVSLQTKNSTAKSPISITLIIKFLNIILYPFKFIPEHSKIKSEYSTIHTFRIGSVFNGYSIDIHIPKKFSFK